jgi:hypothetical protein
VKVTAAAICGAEAYRLFDTRIATKAVLYP